MRFTGAARTGWLALLLLCTACGAARPLLFWRDPLIRGRTQLLDESGGALAAPGAQGVTVNFINRSGRIENSVVSVVATPSGEYRSPVLEPGEYTVEALLPGFAIESQSVAVRSHEHRRVDFALRRIRETSTRSLREAQEENIPHPGEVQILPPPF
jgi:hypothetical protein